MENNLGERIKKARKTTGYSQRKLAEILEVAYQTQNKYEKGHRTPDVNYLRQLVKIADVDPGWLLTGKEGSPSSNEVAEVTQPYDDDRTDEEKEYCGKLVKVLRNPNTKLAIQENLHAFLKVPNIDPMDKVGERQKRGRKPKKSAANGEQ